MRRVEADGDWPLFCPAEAPGLPDTHGAEFDALFLKYEAEGRAKRTVKAQKLWYAILDAQIETGGPFMLYKDAANGTNHLTCLIRPILTSLCCFSQIEPEEPRYHQVLQLMHGNH